MSTPREQIPAQRCWELLATASVGRMALSVRALPTVVPVQYYVTGHRLVACVGHHAIPERSLDDAVVAFTADAIDPTTRSGWSVLVQGRSFIPGRESLEIACGLSTPAQLVEIEPATVTGHYVHPCPYIDMFLSGHQAPT